MGRRMDVVVACDGAGESDRAGGKPSDRVGGERSVGCRWHGTGPGGGMRQGAGELTRRGESTTGGWRLERLGRGQGRVRGSGRGWTGGT